MEENNIPSEPVNNEPLDEATGTGEQAEQADSPPSASAKNIAHSDILQHLLTEVEPINFSELIELPDKVVMTEKHYQFAVVKKLIDIARSKQWNMRNLNDYIYVYNGCYWKQHNKEDIRNFLSDAAIKMGMPEYDAKHYRFVDGLFKQFLSDAHFPAPVPNETKILINLKNGTFEFTPEGWKNKPFDPNDFLTYQLSFSFDQEATSPTFDKYLERVLPDECSRMVLQEFAGYIFTKMNFEKCMVLTGGGSNGKSVFFNILHALVGRENALTFSMSTFSHEGNRAKLTNVLMNYSSDTGFKLNTEIFKALVSGEPLQARELYCKPFTLYNKVKFIMNCNLLPRETENTEAYFRRFLIIPFEVTIKEEERDPNLASRIIANELPGVFNWLLIGLKRLFEQQAFTKCEKAELALAEFRKQADTVQLFIDEFGYQPSTSTKQSLGSLYVSYEEFCRGDRLTPLGKSMFSKELEKKGFEKKPRTNTGISFAIELKVIE
jgi:putative DNA primase/helicase